MTAAMDDANKNFVTSDLLSKDSLRQELERILVFYISKTPQTAIQRDWLHAASILIRGFTFERLNKIKEQEKTAAPKFVNYLSMEFLIGRLLLKNAEAVGLRKLLDELLADFGTSLADLEKIETEPGLGNGGLGRLAACFMDSTAALGVPTFGYGIRYDYGMFKQKILEGQQVELPDMWLLNLYPMEIQRSEIKYLVPFYGAPRGNAEQGGLESHTIYACAYDILLPSVSSKQISRIRLWSAAASEELVLSHFNVGDYARAFYEKNHAENISSVLYPDDRSNQGKELRLMQEYFFASASVQDILFRFTANHNDFDELPNSQAIHLNDTHPALAIAEFMRILTLHYSIDWDRAWGYCERVFSYTNHTLLPEALELWSVSLFSKILPHVLEILYRINTNFLEQVQRKFPGDLGKLARLSLFQEGENKQVRMAHLSIVASHKVNGVSKLHSELMVESIFKDFYQLWPEKFTNVTNGITHRRWLNRANPALTKLIEETLGVSIAENLYPLDRLKNYAQDKEFQQLFMQVKRLNKLRFVEYAKEELGIEISPDSIFSLQVKRIHEYKRQLLNVLHIIHLYDQILANPKKEWVPRTFIISGKAASAYHIAKLTIRLINDVANIINNDMRVAPYLRVVFVPDYSVKLAELMIPTADISEQISTAGFEASGTGNMKLSLNGALTVGTYDGANIEIMEQVGAENFFLFGNRVADLKVLRDSGYDPLSWFERNPNLRKAVNQIRLGRFSPEEEKRYVDLTNNLMHWDPYFVFPDFEPYCKVQEQAAELYSQPDLWAEKAILNVAGMAFFSSDRAIRDYAQNIWNIPVAAPVHQE